MRQNRHGFTLIGRPIVSGRQGAAFTLVELLVVIAIIGILVATSTAGDSSRARSGATDAVREQSQADRDCFAQLRGLAKETARWIALSRSKKQFQL